jgi:hypothetical protein
MSQKTDTTHDTALQPPAILACYNVSAEGGIIGKQGALERERQLAAAFHSYMSKCRVTDWQWLATLILLWILNFFVSFSQVTSETTQQLQALWN